MPRELDQVLANFLKWYGMTSKAQSVTYICENLNLNSQLEQLLNNDIRL